MLRSGWRCALCALLFTPFEDRTLVGQGVRVVGGRVSVEELVIHS